MLTMRNGGGAGDTFSQPPMETEKTNRQKLPIDKVVVFFNQDLENKGYDDAQSNSEDEFKKQKVTELKEQARQVCEAAIWECEDKISDLDAVIIINTNAVLLDTVERLKAQKVKYQKDIERIQQMKIESENDNLKVYSSYCRGFARWQKAIAEGYINTKE